MTGFTVPWSDAQQERLADLVADGHELPEIMRRMPGHPQARLRKKIAEITEIPGDALHPADAGATRADPAPVVREHDAAPDHPTPPAEQEAVPIIAPASDPKPTMAGGGPGTTDGATAASDSGAIRFAITLDARARDLLDAMAAATGKRRATLAAELLTAVLEDDAAAHRDSEAA